MDINNRRRQEVGGAAMAPKFFKIITDPEANKLRIPVEFMRRYGDNLPNRVWLHVPIGSSWKVELVQSNNGETWLNNGWQEFKDYYSLTIGQFLLFDYKGNSQFNVLIFDLDASEIDYPFAAAAATATNHDRVINTKRTESRVPEEKGVESESDDSVVFVKELCTTSKKGTNKEKRKILEKADEVGKNVPNARSDDHKSKKPACGMNEFSLRTKQDSKSEGFSVNIQRSKKNPKSTSGLDSQKMKSQTKKEEGTEVEMQRVDKETCSAYKNAVAFKSDNPGRNPFHISLMQPAYVTNKFQLSLPLTFAKGNLPDKNNDLKLLALNGKTWRVKCNLEAGKAQFTTGWKDFVKDNALKVGDVCVFEVIKKAKLVWNVIVFRS